MELLLKREQQKTFFKGTKYSLFAKLELKPDEQTILNKSKMRGQYIWEGDPKIELSREVGCHIIGALLGISIGIITMALFCQFNIVCILIFLIITPSIWGIVKHFLWERLRDTITVKDLVAGRTIGGGEEMLRVKEQSIKVGAHEINKHITAWKEGGSYDGSSERYAL